VYRKSFEGILRVIYEFLHAKKALEIFEETIMTVSLLNRVERYRVKECLDITKYTHWLADLFYNKETQKDFFVETVHRKSKCDCWCSHFKNYFPQQQQQKTDTTAQLYVL
jgi:hypothetical protein